MACMGKKRWVYTVLVGNWKERDRFDEVGVDERMILKWIFKK